MNANLTERIPRGTLVRSRVVSDLATALADVLDRELTGYALVEPQDSLLLDAEGEGILTFEAGVPVLSYHTGTDRCGPSALSDLAVPGPYRVDCYELSSDDLAAVHDTPELQVPPEMPADRLTDDPDLAARTRAVAPDERRASEPVAESEEPSSGAVEAFLDDEDRIAAIREEAREEAEHRAEQWGLGDELRDDR